MQMPHMGAWRWPSHRKYSGKNQISPLEKCVRVLILCACWEIYTELTLVWQWPASVLYRLLSRHAESLNTRTHFFKNFCHWIERFCLRTRSKSWLHSTNISRCSQSYSKGTLDDRNQDSLEGKPNHDWRYLIKWCRGAPVMENRWC